MRVDKYLKVSRVLKRRNVAKELGDAGRILINGKIAKASSEVKVNDVIDLQFGHQHLQIQVLQIKTMVKKDEDPVFKVLKVEKVSNTDTNL